VKSGETSRHRRIVAAQRGDLAAGGLVFDLAGSGVDNATSSGFIDNLVPQLEELKVGVVEGRIEVPTVPDERR
jgi:hypothetical protein